MKNNILSIINAKDEFELVEKVNEDSREFFATTPVQKIDGNWVMFCYQKKENKIDEFREKRKLENEKPTNEQSATKSQIYYLKQNKIPHKENLTKKEAFKLIKEHKEEKSK